MKCFGGPGIKKKACRKRKCISLFPAAVKREKVELSPLVYGSSEFVPCLFTAFLLQVPFLM